MIRSEAEEDEVGEDGGPREKMEIIPLGGGQEVGRSCIVVKYRGKIIMLDCGLHSQKVGHEALPLLDIFDDLPKVDLLLVMTVNPGFGGQSTAEATAGGRPQTSQAQKWWALEPNGI